MSPFNSRRSRETGAVPSARSSAADSPRPQCPKAESRIAIVCYGLQIGCRSSRTTTTADPSLIAYLAAKAPGGPLDARSGSGRSKRGPARLRQNVAVRTRIFVRTDQNGFESRFATEYAGLQIRTSRSRPLVEPTLIAANQPHTAEQSQQRGFRGGRSVCHGVLATLCSRRGRQSVWQREESKANGEHLFAAEGRRGMRARFANADDCWHRRSLRV
jgi:hypothetical protein